MAPIAPDVPCALRTIRALRDEDFDILHKRFDHEQATHTAFNLPEMGSGLRRTPQRYSRLNGDNVVNVDDILVAISGFGDEYNVEDILEVLAYFGTGC